MSQPHTETPPYIRWYNAHTADLVALATVGARELVSAVVNAAPQQRAQIKRAFNAIEPGAGTTLLRLTRIPTDGAA